MQEFVHFIARLMKNADPENEVKECYRRFDPENEGVVRTDELRFIMSNLPVKLTDEEVTSATRSTSSPLHKFIA